MDRLEEELETLYAQRVTIIFEMRKAKENFEIRKYNNQKHALKLVDERINHIDQIMEEGMSIP